MWVFGWVLSWLVVEIKVPEVEEVVAMFAGKEYYQTVYGGRRVGPYSSDPKGDVEEFLESMSPSVTKHFSKLS